MLTDTCHTFVSLANEHFTARVTAGQCLINVAGMTWDCLVIPERMKNGFSYNLSWWPYGLKRTATVYPDDLSGGPLHYSVERILPLATGYATLIVPSHGLLRMPPTVSGPHPDAAALP